MTRKKTSKNGIIAIVGPTASGKTAASIKIARAIGGEIISADSRQVYTGLDIGSGKVTKKEMVGIPHHLLDIASPKRVYTVSDFVSDAARAIDDIRSRGKTPIICGGTGFYIDALLYGIALPGVPPNLPLRKKLLALPAEKLYAMLRKRDPKRAEDIHPNNKFRIVRALEIIEALGKVPKLEKPTLRYDAKIYGIQTDRKTLEEKIYKRLISRIKGGMIKEVSDLHKAGLSWSRMDALGLEYRHIARHLRGKTTKEEMTAELYRHICNYAKRQATWFKRNKDITWLTPEQLVKRFAHKNKRSDGK